MQQWEVRDQQQASDTSQIRAFESKEVLNTTRSKAPMQHAYQTLQDFGKL